ncbi:ABC transporter ATP-binding protein [Algivirga pacifica]|uniref:ABC transporter ATP-binding protein n=1 Tax=Algivirga pacifica TaxID=1162670 RepID=A0ABP9DNA9_9BACT
MLTTHQLSYQYTKGNTIAFPDLSIVEGEHFLILGQSGCGKTTLLHLLSGLLRTQKGAITIDGTNLSELSSKSLDTFRGQYIGVIFQKPHFVKSLSVEEHLLTAQYLAQKPQDRQKIKSLLAPLNLLSKKDKKISQLSEGEKQRVSVAMALVNEPKLILADEPTASLDDYHAQEVADMLEEYASKANATLIIVTHDQRLKKQFPKYLELS